LGDVFVKWGGSVVLNRGGRRIGGLAEQEYEFTRFFEERCDTIFA